MRDVTVSSLDGGLRRVVLTLDDAGLGDDGYHSIASDNPLAGAWVVAITYVIDTDAPWRGAQHGQAFTRVNPRSTVTVDVPKPKQVRYGDFTYRAGGRD